MGRMLARVDDKRLFLEDIWTDDESLALGTFGRTMEGVSLAKCRKMRTGNRKYELYRESSRYIQQYH